MAFNKVLVGFQMAFGSTAPFTSRLEGDGGRFTVEIDK